MPIDEDKRESPSTEEEGKEAEKSMRHRLEGLIPDLVKRTVSAGLGAAVATEEQIRKMATEFSVPKDVVNYLLSTAQSTKDELFKIFAREMREFLQGLNLNQELAKLLTSLSFEIKTEIRFIPNEEAVGKIKPDMKRKVSIKRVKDDGSTEDVPAES